MDGHMRESKKKVITELFEWFKDILIAMVVTLFIVVFLFQNTQVIGDSMEPTLQDGNSVIVNKFIYRFKPPQYGDIIAFEYQMDPSQYFIKRVIGVQGDTIDIKAGRVYLNNQVLEELYILEPMNEFIDGNMQFPLVIPKNYCFVMGDNRNISLDSRYKEVGLVPLGSISGKAFFRMWPLGKIGHLK